MTKCNFYAKAHQRKHHSYTTKTQSGAITWLVGLVVVGFPLSHPQCMKVHSCQRSMFKWIYINNVKHQKHI